MAFISTPGPEAGDATAAMYVSAEESYGYLPNMYRIFGHRPEVMEKWGALLASIRGHMSLRRYELVTLAAARELKSSYCMLAHGSVLLREGFSETQLADTATDGAHAPLDEAEREMMRFAAKVVRDATSITRGCRQAEGARLHRCGNLRHHRGSRRPLLLQQDARRTGCRAGCSLSRAAAGEPRPDAHGRAQDRGKLSNRDRDAVITCRRRSAAPVPPASGGPYRPRIQDGTRRAVPPPAAAC